MEIWDEVISVYNDELNKLKNVVGDGNAETFSHYKHLVGQIQGIEWARHTFTTIAKT
mgnify:FL=1